MTRQIKQSFLLMVCLGSLAVVAQPAPPQVKTALSATAPAAEADMLGRETPSGTVFGFLQTAQLNNYRTAAQYLQFKSSTREADREDLASKLRSVMDRAFVGSLKNISSNPDGNLEMGPADRQRVGRLVAGDAEADLVLVRVNDPSSGGRVWLISSETLEKIPEVYD